MVIEKTKHKIFNIIIMITLTDIITVQGHVKELGLNYILHYVPGPREKRDTHFQRPRHPLIPNLMDFSVKNCKYQNCIFTKDKSYFPDATYFDAILFDPIFTYDKFVNFHNADPPELRSEDQIYIFVSQESAAYYPVREANKYNNFFNYTWTYKLNSDIPLPFTTVKDKRNGDVVAPKKKVNWIENMNFPIKEKLKNKLKSKKIAAAWFVSNCATSNGRYDYGMKLKDVLMSYNLGLDIYGDCGPFVCPKEDWEECLAKVRSDYYFYLAFENSNCEDYVTEKLITAVNNLAIPVVFGGANYSRFMPDRIYLDAKTMIAQALGEKMNQIIKNKTQYYTYFKWHNYYSYHSPWDSPETNPNCAFCAFLNGDWRNKRQVYAKFTDWWNRDNFTSNETIVYFDVTETRSYEEPKRDTVIDRVSKFFTGLFDFKLTRV